MAACWQVASYDSNDELQHFASSFAVDEHLLATNAHVVRTFANVIREGGSVRAFQGETGLERRIGRVWLHPGYDLSDDVFKPDVGLLGVADTLPSTLNLAVDRTLEDVSVMTELRLYGFPGDVTEAIEYDDLRYGMIKPSVTCLTGRVTAIRHPSPLWFAKENGDWLIQHDIPATGGTSGSPILNERGEVIAINSGGTHNKLGQNRFAIRSDVLGNLLGMVKIGTMPEVDVDVKYEPEPDPEPESEFQAFINETADAVGGWPVAAMICIGTISLTFLQLARMRAKLQRQSIERMDRFVEVMQTKITDIESKMNGMRPQLNNSYDDDTLITVSSDELPPLFAGRWTGSTAVGLVLMAIGAAVWTALPLRGVALVAVSLTLVVASSRTCVRTLNRIDRRLPSRARLVLRLQRSKKGSNVFDTATYPPTEVSDAVNYTI